MRDHTDTNTHTYFFREADALRVASAHLAERARLNGRRARAWSAGCSTGDEPYSLAILVAEQGATAEILATDINPNALAAAAGNRHSIRALRYVEADRLERWFEPVAKQSALRVGARKMVRFDQHDIARDVAPRSDGHGWDVILCRNVLIYLDVEAVGRAVTRFADALAPDGLLLLGASEWLSSKLQRHAPRLAALELVDLGGVVGYRKQSERLGAPASGSALFSPERPFDGVQPAPNGTRLRLRTRQTPAASVERPIRRSLSPLERSRNAGDRALDEGQDDVALTHFDAGLAENDLAADLHLRRGLALLRLGRPVEALSALRRSLFLEPALWPAAMLLGDLVAEEDGGAAARYFRQAREALGSSGAGNDGLSGALAPFAAGRAAALEAIELRLADLERTALAAGVRRSVQL